MTMQDRQKSTVRNMIRQPVTALATISIILQSIAPAFAQVAADPTAPVARQPAIDQAANGRTIVQITAPNASGLSHNQFSDFNVPEQGIILNNSAELTRSQMAGLVLANPKLTKGQEASLILNEVTSTRRSTLNGFLEVNGRAAGVIVANPNGITCSGCGFINTPRVTLTTGRAVLGNDGALQSFSVGGGDIAVEGLGLDASRVSKLDIVTRALQINAIIQGRDVAVSGGRQSYDYASGNATGIVDDGSPKPLFFLDSTAIGGMFADRIKIVGTEAGLGIRTPQNMAASLDDMELRADGKLVLRNASAAGRITAQSASGDIEVAGIVYSDTSVNASAAGGLALANSAVLGAKDSITIRAGALTVGDAVLAGGLNADGTLNASQGSAALDVRGNVNVAARGLINGGNSLTLTSGGSITSNGTVQSSGNLMLSAQTGVSNAGLISSANDVTIRSAQDITSAATGRFEAGQDLLLAATNHLGLSGTTRANRDVSLSSIGAEIGNVSAGRDAILTGNTLSQNGAFAAGRNATLTYMGSAALTANATIGAVGNLALTAAAITNSGTLVADGSLSLRGGTAARAGTLSNRAGGRIAGGTNVSTDFNRFDNAGLLTSNRDVTLTSATAINSGEVTAANALTITVSAATNAGRVTAKTVTSTTDSLTNASTGVLQAVDALALNSGSISNAGQLASNGTISLAANQFTNSDGRAVATGNLTVGAQTTGASTNRIDITGGQIGSVTGNVGLTAQTIANAGSISAGGSVALQSAQDVTNTATGRIEANDDVRLSAARNLVSAGMLRANRDVVLDTQSLTTSNVVAGRNAMLTGTGFSNLGVVTAGNDAVLSFSGSVQNDASFSVGAGRNVDILSSALSNAGTLAAGNSVTLRGTGLSVADGVLRNAATGQISANNIISRDFSETNNFGLIRANNSVDLGGSAFTNNSELSSKDALALNFSVVDNLGLIDANSARIAATSNIINRVVQSNPQGGVIQATQALQLLAPTVRNESLIASGGTLTASVGNLSNTEALIIAKGTVTIEGATSGSRATLVHNASGNIESTEGDIVIRALTLQNFGDGLVERRTSNIAHEFAQSPPPPGLAFFPHLLSPEGYFQLYDGGRTRTYVWVPSPEMVDEILRITGRTIDQWTPDLWRQFAPDPATYDPTKWSIFVPDEARNAPVGSFVRATDERDVVTKQNTPGQILTSRGNIMIDAGLLHNKQSTIAANGNLSLTGGSVLNEGLNLTRNYSLSLSFNNDTVRTQGWTRTNLGTGPSIFFGRGNPGPILFRSDNIGAVASTITATGAITGNLAGTFANVGSPATDPSTLSFANTSTNLVGVAPPTVAVLPGAVNIVGASGTGTGANGGNAGAISNVTGISQSQLRAFAPAIDSSRFVIETRLAFINVADFFGSDYFFDRLGMRPEGMIKLLGDAYFDTTVIRSQILQLTGKQFLDPELLSDQAQVKILLENGVAEAKRLNLALGVALTEDQVQRLTKDIVFYVESEFKGQRVLVPQLFLSNATRAKLSARSARVNADSIALSAASVLNDNGSFAATNELKLRGDTIVDIGGTLKADSIVLEANDSIQFLAQIEATGDGTNRIGAIVSPRSFIDARSITVTASKADFVGTVVNATENVTINADTFSLTPVEAEIGQRYKDETLSYDTYQKTLFVPEFTVGGDLTINANDSALIRAATLNVGNDIRIHAGELLIDSGATESSASGGLKKNGFTKTETTWDYLTVTQVPTVIRSGGDITIETTVGDTTIRASVLDANNISIDSAGKINLEAAYDRVRKQDTKTGSSFVWVSSKDQGLEQVLVVQTELRARGEVALKAQNGIVIQIKQNGDLGQSISTLAQAPGLAWLQKIADDPNVKIDLVKDSFKEWKKETGGLAGPAAVVIALAVAAATQGAGAGLLSSAFGTSLGATSGAVASAGFSSLVTQATIGLINGKGNPLAALKSLTSSEYARSLATTLVTAGLLQGAAGQKLLSAQPQSILGRVNDSFVRAGISTSVDTAINGGKFGENLLQNLKIEAANTVGASIAGKIGAAAQSSNPSERINQFSRYAAHVALGCAVGAVSGNDCSSGAAGAAVGELTADIYKTLSLPDSSPNLANLIESQRETWLKRGVDIAKLSGATAAWLIGLSPSVAASAAENAAENNAFAGALPAAGATTAEAANAARAARTGLAVCETLPILCLFGAVLTLSGDTPQQPLLNENSAENKEGEKAASGQELRPSDGKPIRDGSTPDRPGKSGVQDGTFDKPGGIEEANADFDNEVDPATVKPLDGGGRTGKTPTGENITVRPTSGDGRPTVEITTGNKGNRNTDKFRYGKKP